MSLGLTLEDVVLILKVTSLFSVFCHLESSTLREMDIHLSDTLENACEKVCTFYLVFAVEGGSCGEIKARGFYAEQIYLLSRLKTQAFIL